MTLSRKIDRHERDIFDAIQMAFARRHDRFRLALDHVIHDGEIVRRQIPDDADIVLKQSQVHPQRIVVVQIAQSAAFVSSRILRTAPVNRNVWSTMMVRFFRAASSIEFFRLLRARSERLLDETRACRFRGAFLASS